MHTFLRNRFSSDSVFANALLEHPGLSTAPELAKQIRYLLALVQSDNGGFHAYITNSTALASVLMKGGDRSGLARLLSDFYLGTAVQNTQNTEQSVVIKWH